MHIKRRGKVQFLAVFLFCLILIPIKTNAWDTGVAHPEIVKLGIEIYNDKFDRKITKEEESWIVEGVMAEDTPLRWFNHFYDPVRNIGFKNMWPKLSDWAIDSKGQRDYALGDKSWYRAIDEYQNDNKSEAFKSLGHTLHLIADASVPAHTRDDSHPEGDSLEQFVKYNWENLEKYLPKGEFKKVTSLYDAFYSSVKYSNEQFYSDDTIESELYEKIEIKDYEEFDWEGKKLYFAISDKKLFYTDNIFVWGNATLKKIDNYQILLNYSQHLIPKATGYTAGVIELFFKEVGKEQEVELSKNSKEGIFGWLNRQVGNVITISKELFGSDEFYNPVMMPVGAEEGEILKQPVSSADKVQDDKRESDEIPASAGMTKDVLDTSPATPTTPPATPTTPPVIPAEAGISDNIYLVQRIIDGDTFEITIGGIKQSVRIIGIDTPEKNKCFFDESKKKATELLLRKRVKLVKDSNIGDVDQYGRLLRYVYRVSDNLFFNQEMIKGGFAREYNFKGEGYDFVSDFEAKEEKAKADDLGLWEKCYEKKVIYSGGGGNINENIAPPIAPPIEGATTTQQISTTTPEGEDDNEPATSTDPNIGNTTTTFSTSTDPNTGGGSNVTTTTPTSTPSITDITPPTIPEITIQNNSGFNSKELLITASSTDDYSENIFYDLEFSTNTLDWIVHSTSSPQSQFSFLGERGQGYYFRSRAEDESKNLSNWSDSNTSTILIATKINLSQDVVINEIAWAGAYCYPNHEWLEFYNNTDEDIDLTNWVLEISGSIVNFTKTVNPIISAHGYYLVERINDNSVARIDADRFYTGSLNNDGEKIILKNPSKEVIDEVDCEDGWFAGENGGNYPSMERINSLVVGNNQSNWQTSQGERKAGPGYSGNMGMYGSPRTSNFGNITLSGNQVEDLKILTKINNPYILDSYIVPIDKILQIESGVVVKSFTNKSNVRVFGSLKILGTDEEKVVMTSGRDENVEGGEEKVGNYDDGDSQAEDWVGFIFEPGSVGEFAGLDFRYAGAKKSLGAMFGFVYNAINLNGASLNISNSRFYQTGQKGINSLNSNITVSNSEFDSGVQALYSKYSDVSLTDLNIKNFTSVNGALEIFDNFPEMNSLIFESNVTDRIKLNAVILTKDEILKNDIEYIISGVEVPVTKVLTIEPGVDIQMHANGVFKIEGVLSARGTLGQEINIYPIVSTSAWGHIEFNNSNSELEYVNMSDGKSHSHTHISNNAMIIMNDSEVIFSNCILNNIKSSGNVILSKNSVLSITGGLIGEDEKFVGYPMTSPTYTAGIDASGGELIINNVEFKNLNIGVFGIDDIEDFSGSIIDSTFTNVDYWNLW